MWRHDYESTPNTKVKKWNLQDQELINVLKYRYWTPRLRMCCLSRKVNFNYLKFTHIYNISLTLHTHTQKIAFAHVTLEYYSQSNNQTRFLAHINIWYDWKFSNKENNSRLLCIQNRKQTSYVVEWIVTQLSNKNSNRKYISSILIVKYMGNVCIDNESIRHTESTFYPKNFIWMKH